MKIAIIGISGTGKSTLARVLHKRLDTEPLFADSYIWGANWTLRDRATASQEMLDALKKRSGWIFDGYLPYIADYLLTHTDAVIYLDYSGIAALIGILKRWWQHRNVPRLEFAPGCKERFHWRYFFYVVLFRKDREPIEQLLTKYPPKKLYRVRSKKGLERLLKSDLKT